MIGSAADYTTDAQLQERIVKGATYFLKKLKEVEALVSGTSLQTDNKEVKKRAADSFNALVEVLQFKHRLLAYVAQSGFALSTYLRAKALATIDEAERVKDVRTPRTSTARVSASALAASAGASSVILPSDIKHRDVYERLRVWRKQRADAEGLPAYCIMQTKTMIDVSNTLPTTAAELAAVKGFGKNKTLKYGDDVLRIVSLGNKK
ncbi:MAG: HRDC domain-containing protein [Prevotella sp.]|nr:HRDC domain-containing protein [Prevotella sp.]